MSRRNILLPILSGILLALAFPRFNLWWLAWVALVPFFMVLIHRQSLKASLFYAFCFGLFFFGIHLFWINSLFPFVGWWIFLGWVVLVLFQTLFILLFVFLLRFINPAKIYYPLFLALLWVLVEWIRAAGAFGFSAGDIGYSQAALLPLIQIASFSSVYGVSFLVVLINISLAFFLAKIPGRGFVFSMAILLLLSAYIYGVVVMGEKPKEAEKSIRLSLIQPNIDQRDKLNPNKILYTFKIHEEMTQAAMLDLPDIVIWPETAIFSYLLDDPLLFPRMKKLAKTWILFGTPYYGGGGKIYNSVVALSPGGKISSRYDKEHLVPFGEYLPGRPALYPLLKSVGYYDAEFNIGSEVKPLLASGAKIAAAICFESTFPYLIRKRVAKDSDFILTVTNDAWFGNSAVPYSHLNAGIFRAIENRKYFVQVGNTGISAVIDPYGRILKKSKVGEKTILRFEIPLS